MLSSCAEKRLKTSRLIPDEAGREGEGFFGPEGAGAGTVEEKKLRRKGETW